MNGYLIIIESESVGYRAWSPDLPGCHATAATREDARQAMRLAVGLHLRGLRARGHTPPDPIATMDWVKVAT